MIHRESPLTDTKSLPYDLMEALNFAVLYRLHKQQEHLKPLKSTVDRGNINRGNVNRANVNRGNDVNRGNTETGNKQQSNIQKEKPKKSRLFEMPRVKSTTSYHPQHINHLQHHQSSKAFVRPSNLTQNEFNHVSRPLDYYISQISTPEPEYHQYRVAHQGSPTKLHEEPYNLSQNYDTVQYRTRTQSTRAPTQSLTTQNDSFVTSRNERSYQMTDDNQQDSTEYYSKQSVSPFRYEEPKSVLPSFGKSELKVYDLTNQRAKSNISESDTKNESFYESPSRPFKIPSPLRDSMTPQKREKPQPTRKLEKQFNKSSRKFERPKVQMEIRRPQHRPESSGDEEEQVSPRPVMQTMRPSPSHQPVRYKQAQGKVCKLAPQSSSEESRFFDSQFEDELSKISQSKTAKHIQINLSQFGPSPSNSSGDETFKGVTSASPSVKNPQKGKRYR